MFFQLLYIHLFRPFLQYTKETCPLPDTVSPRKLCTAAASQISKLMRLYKRSHGLRQICNVCVYIVHSATTIHLLNLPEKGAKRDIVHGVKHLEEIAEGWLCARRSLGMVSVLAKKWKVELPEDAVAVLARTDRKFGPYTGDAPSPGTLKRQPEGMDASLVDSGPGWGMGPSRQVGNGFAGSGAAAVGMQQAFPTSQPKDGGFRQHPPYDPNGLQAHRFPAGQHFHSTTTPSPPPRSMGHHSAVGPGSAAVGSPSNMFGGIEQLIQESNDWTYRDQAQLATGFENWTGMDVSPAIWQNGGSMPGQISGVSTAAGTVGGAMVASMPATTGYAQNVSAGESAYPTFAMNGANFMAGYNEEEWYQ